MRRSTRQATLAALVASLVGAAHASAQGCAMCGTVLGNDARANAFKWSIIFLMAAPYVLAGVVAGWLYLSVRRSRAASRPGRLGVEGDGLTTDYKESLT